MLRHTNTIQMDRFNRSCCQVVYYHNYVYLHCTGHNHDTVQCDCHAGRTRGAVHEDIPELL